MFLDGVLAALPLTVVLFLMVGRHWPAAPAGALGLGAAFLLATTRFADSAAGDGIAHFAVGTIAGNEQGGSRRSRRGGPWRVPLKFGFAASAARLALRTCCATR